LLRLRSDGTSSLVRASFLMQGELGAPIGPVGVRITTGSIRNCVRFDAPTIRRDEQGRFVAAHAQAGSVVDCEHATLSGLVGCGDSDAPTCGGFCASDVCLPDGASGCRCQPPPPPPCGDEVAFACQEGACPEGSSCNYTSDLLGCFCQPDSTPCGDSGPICHGECPSGQECVSINGHPAGNGGCSCLPAGSVGCGGSDQCGGDCPDGLQCYPYTSYHGFWWCGCASSPPCGPSGCPPGKTCTMLPNGFWQHGSAYGCVPF
jgi:hypothetical protein